MESLFGGKTMKKYALGAAVAALGIVHQTLPASADKLDDLVKRMDAIEQNNKQLAKENAALRSQLRAKPAPATTTIMAAPGGKPTATVTGVATPPRALDAPEIDAQGHGFLEHKKGNPLTFYTPGGEITAYGNFDISIDDTTKNLNNFNLNGASPPVGNFGWLPAVATNASYLGVRGLQRLPDFPLNFVYQLEVGFSLSGMPSTRESNSNLSNTVSGALFNRNTWVGFANPEFGAIKIGKTYAPYETSTGGFNPFNGQIGDMRVVMGNTGGDNRVEFGTRLTNSIWYESPTIYGFQWNALFAFGQNRSLINDNIPQGGSDCTGGNDPTSGGDLPISCSDGGFGNAVSANLSYTNGPFYATVAYERHFGVNRQSDFGAIYGLANAPIQILTDVSNCANVLAATQAGVTQSPPLTLSPQAAANYLTLCNADVADEDAFKVAALYTFPTKTTVGGIFEWMHRYVPQFLQFQNERQRNGSWLFVTQELTPVDSISFGWAHAFRTPGDIGQHNSALLPTNTGVQGFSLPSDGAGVFGSNDNSSNMITATYKHKFGTNLTWYTAVAATINGPSAHYDLGPGGVHGIATDCHDAFAASGGLASNPHCFTGTVLAGGSTGIQWRF
jgi:predicted porin